MTINEFSKEFNEVKIVKGKNFQDDRGVFKKTIYGESLKTLMPTPSEVLNSTSKKMLLEAFITKTHHIK